MGKYFAILPDAGCDLADTIRKEYDIDIIHGHYLTPDGEEHQTHLNWDNVDRETFYTDLKKDPNGYKTSPPDKTILLVKLLLHKFVISLISSSTEYSFVPSEYSEF